MFSKKTNRKTAIFNKYNEKNAYRRKTPNFQKGKKHLAKPSLATIG